MKKSLTPRSAHANIPVLALSLLAPFIALPSAASTLKWPVPTEIKVYMASPTSAFYYVTWTPMPFEWPERPGYGTVYDMVKTLHNVSMPMERYDLVSVGACHRHTSETPGGVPGMECKWRGETYGDAPAGHLAAIAQVWAEANTTIVHNFTVPDGECIGLFASNKPNGPHGWPVGQNPGVSWSPFGPTDSCLGTPPANQWCALVTPSLQLDYGAINVKNAPGSSVEESVSVHCTTGMKYTLRLRGKDYIDLSNGMRASIVADDKALGGVLNGTSGLNTVNVKAVLQGTPQRTGDMEGQGVLYVAYP